MPFQRALLPLSRPETPFTLEAFDATLSNRKRTIHIWTNFIDQNNHLDYILVRVTRKKSKIKMKKSTKSSYSTRPGNRWRLQDAKAHLSEVVRQAQQRGPQRVTLHGRDAVVVVRAEEFDRMRRPISGRDIVAALATSPLAGVNFERMTVKSPVRDVSL
jgi:prevent-host-death family protein